MLEALCDYLLDKPVLYLHEMELFFLGEFEVSVPKSTISDALHRKGWSKKTARQKAKERNPDLRDGAMILRVSSIYSCGNRMTDPVT